MTLLPAKPADELILSANAAPTKTFPAENSFCAAPTVKEVHNLPTKGKPLSVVGTINESKLIKYRCYGEDGYVEKDVDLTNHGNSKEHQIVPHLHVWSEKIDKKSGKLRLIRLKGSVLTKNELDDLRRWQGNG